MEESEEIVGKSLEGEYVAGERRDTTNPISGRGPRIQYLVMGFV